MEDRPGTRRRHPVAVRGLSAGRAPCTLAARWPRWCTRSSKSTGASCLIVRLSWWGSSIWPIRSRSRGSTNPIWMYAHVPNGYGGDATDAALEPCRALRPRLSASEILRCVVSTPAGLQEYNPNFRGGDILTGANNVRQLVLRPRPLLSTRISWASRATTCARPPRHRVLVCTACAVSSQRSPR